MIILRSMDLGRRSTDSFYVYSYEIHLICEIIMGDKRNAPDDWKWVGAPGREFLLQIVANSK